MKKLAKLISLGVVSGALALGFATKQQVQESKAIDYETYIPMENFKC